jgi:hypothetical protein
LADRLRNLSSAFYQPSPIHIPHCLLLRGFISMFGDICLNYYGFYPSSGADSQIKTNSLESREQL